MRLKPKKEAFSIDDLPSNRREQFFDFLKTDPLMFLKIGLLLLLFALPFLFAFLFKYYVLLYPASKSMEETAYLSFYETTSLLFNGIYAFCFFFLFLSFAGLGRIVRQWAWGNGIYFWHDFGKGAKQNFKSYVVYWLLFSLAYFVCETLFLVVRNSLVSYFASGLCLLLSLPLMMAMSESLVYANSTGKCLLNGFSYVLKRPLVSLAFFLFPCAAICLSLLNQIMVLLLALTLFFLLILPLYFVGWHLYCFSLFDAFTNKAYYPDLYKKGLRYEFKKEAEE